MKLKRLAAACAVLALTAACTGGSDDADASDENGSAPEENGNESQEDDADGQEEVGDDFPTEPITIVVTFAPGGGNDLLMRSLAPKMTEILGVDVAVENVEGGGGVIGLTEAFQRDADGYTLVSYSPPGEYLSQVQGQLAEFSVDDFTMLGATNVDPGAFAVPMDSPYETLEELNAAIGEENLTAATSGLTSNNAVGGFSYMAATGLEFELVPYDSGAELTAALIGGTTDFGIRAGGWYDLHDEELRILAFTNSERVEEFPDIPTVGEVTGEDVIFSSLRGLAVRSDAPQERIDILTDAFEQAANDPEIVDNLLDEIGFRWEYLSAADAQAVAEQMMADVDSVASVMGID